MGAEVKQGHTNFQDENRSGRQNEVASPEMVRKIRDFGLPANESPQQTRKALYIAYWLNIWALKSCGQDG